MAAAKISEGISSKQAGRSWFVRCAGCRLSAIGFDSNGDEASSPFGHRLFRAPRGYWGVCWGCGLCASRAPNSSLDAESSAGGKAPDWSYQFVTICMIVLRLHASPGFLSILNATNLVPLLVR